MTITERWAARLQRKADRRQADWQELERFRRTVPSGPVAGPGGSTAVISVHQTGARWLTRGTAVSTGGGGALVLVSMLITEVIWWLVFRRTYTVRVRTNGRPPLKLSVRLPSEMDAYRAAAQLVSRFQADGPIVLQGQWADGTAPT